ncbi:MAG: ATP-binding protein [Pseudomonadota bacterium]
MSNSKKMRFIANARLKDVVGRGLINNDNIAIIELIKNSKDAGSKSVSIEYFESDEEQGQTELYITDNGRGMSAEDIEFKWLNIAYSEKKTSTPKDGGAYAGSKGIGRFSCDRLGSKLDIYTRTKGSRYVALSIDWSDYEVDDPDIQIGAIEAEARFISPRQFEDESGIDKFDHGTLLIIRDLRSNWTKDKLKSLRRELERFVIDPNQKFEIEFSHWRYDDDDEINSPIENKVFSDLDFRTTSISASIDSRGKHIQLELRHDGDFIFKSKEKNPYKHLSSISAKIYFLNQPAKAFFKRRTGYRSVKYGSIFLFINGFRVFPYGSEGDDWLGLDRRRQQGQRRFFGTRDLVGYIEVTDSQNVFQAVSSREGLVQNEAFVELTAPLQEVTSAIDNQMLYGFIHKLTRKLEQFVVAGLDWDRIARSNSVDDDELLAGQFEYLKTEKPVLETIDSVVKIRSPADHIEDIEINVQYLSDLAEQETEEYKDLVESIERKFDGVSIDKLKPTEKRDLSKFVSRTVKEISAKDTSNVQLERKRARVEKELKAEKKRRLFAEAHSTSDEDRILQLHHQVNLIADGIWKRLNGVSKRYRTNPDRYTKDDLVDVIESGQFEIERIRNVTKLALKADFDLMTNKVNADVIQFIDEYIQNYRDILHALSIRVTVENKEKVTLRRSFRPIEMTILIDNILVNAGKAGASRVRIVVKKRGKKVVIQFANNGKVLTKRFEASDLFKKGISTTSGSGVGLNHVREIVTEMKGKVSIRNDEKEGVILEVIF